MTSTTAGKWIIRAVLIVCAAAFAPAALADRSHGGHYGHGYGKGYGYGHGKGYGYGYGHVRSYGYGYGHGHGHTHYYPRYGYVYNTLPYGYSSVYYGGAPYYYHGGAWYRPYGPRFVVVAPPIGIGVGVLPPYYSTVWYGGAPYYYAGNNYYQWYPERREYVVSRPPANQPEESASTRAESDDIYVYPKNGQSEAQQSDDRYECHAWAVQQSGFDPTRSNGGVAASEMEARRAAYRRAEIACLEGRGYSVR